MRSAARTVLVCGSRSWRDARAVAERLGALSPGTLVVHGGAPGADELADRYARAFGLDQRLYWPGDASDALRRNDAMLAERPDLVIAFWDGASRGTAHTIREAERRGIPVEVISAAARSS